jgi:hypothetical protein
MANKKYERYIIKEPLRSADFFDKAAASFMTMPPMTFLNGDEPVKGSGQFAEAIWIFSDSPLITPEERQAHFHEFDELFMYLGANQKDMKDLGGEVELWIGEGKEAEKYNFTTSSGAFIPKGLMHGPMNFRNVKRPFLYLTFGFNVGDKYGKTKPSKK